MLLLHVRLAWGRIQAVEIGTEPIKKIGLCSEKVSCESASGESGPRETRVRTTSDYRVLRRVRGTVTTV